MQRGFSLVELSIVLVILGLLVGGILAGQSLIRASELRAVGTEWQRYTTATSAFRDKYFAMPGDMLTATTFWGPDPNCPGTYATPLTTGTCNGDGDGIINTGNERYRFWHHLAKAGLIEGNYTGVSGSAGAQHAEPGSNVPASKMSKGGWTPANLTTGGSGLFMVNYGNHFRYGAKSASNATHAPLMTTEEAWNVDIKIDDGSPAAGKVFAYTRSACTTGASDSDFTAEYKLTATGAACAFYFANAF